MRILILSFNGKENRMDYLIKNTTKKQRTEIIKKALAISMSGADIPTDEALKITKEYIEGITELEDVQKKIVNLYKRS